ncbi:sigma-70 family RNA polymerase sigma factor [Clostridium sardiniense]|uniref:sigma-70 family RNA polymerase sigma factor n=1 Tax=Clostridium sardiniense TaxID=29369 RepID=UPI003D33EDC0
MCDLLLINLAKENNSNAKEELIIKYSPIIKSQIKKYAFIDCYDNEDLMQYGALCILKAIDTFDTNKSSSFSSYVKWTISNNFAYLCRKNNIDKKALSLNNKTDGGIEVMDFLEEKATTEDIIIGKYEDNRIETAANLLSAEYKHLFDFLMYSGVKCPLKRYSEIYCIPYSKCLYRKKKLADNLKVILFNI